MIHFRSLALCLPFISLALGASAQAAVSPVQVAPVQIAMLNRADTILPDAPSYSTSNDEGQAGGIGITTTRNQGTVAPKYTGIIPSGLSSQPLSAGDKVKFGFAQAFSLYNVVPITASAVYSHLVDSAPHYGTNSQAFGKRVGAAALRSTVQVVATDSVFAPIFHTDPRYYELGRTHSFVGRVVYAAERVVVTKSDGGSPRLNAPLLLGYAAAAGANNAIYPDQDTGATKTAKNFGTSLIGAAASFEVNEFLDDALRIVHIRKN